MEESHRQIPRFSIFYPLLYLGFALLSVWLPLVIWSKEWPLAKSVYGEWIEPIELFTLFASLGLILFGGLELRKARGKERADQAVIVLGLAVGFFYLILLSLFSFPSWDYKCYQEAAEKVLLGKNPYDSCYLYPPLLAQVMAFAFSLFSTEWLPPSHNQGQDLVMAIFYLYQATQFFLILLAYFLQYLLARELKVEKTLAALLSAGLLIFNNAALSTFRENQVNFWVLDCVLFALLLIRRAPVLGGVGLALGIHLKLYPAILLLPWTLSRQWKIVLATLMGCVLLLAIQTNLGADLSAWQQFLSHLQHFPERNSFRNNSLPSLIYNLFWAASLLGSYKLESLGPAIKITTLIATVGVIGGFLARFVQREILFARQTRGGDKREDLHLDRLYGHALDAVALSLLISPVAWAHHYLLASPLMIYAIARQQKQRPWTTATACLLIVAFPNFDFFLLSYHRLAGLALLIFLISPAIIFKNASPHGLCGKEQNPTLI